MVVDKNTLFKGGYVNASNTTFRVLLSPSVNASADRVVVTKLELSVEDMDSMKREVSLIILMFFT